MKMLRYIQVRLSPEQYERIKVKAQAKGHKTISAFIREVALEKDLLFEQRFDEMYRQIKKLSFNKKTTLHNTLSFTDLSLPSKKSKMAFLPLTSIK